MDTRLEIAGLVNRPSVLTIEDLAALQDQIPDVAMVAPGREGVAVRLRALLDSVSPMEAATFISLQAEGDFSASIPLEPVLDEAILIYRLGGEPLPAAKGGPIRFMIPNPAACGTAEIDHCANVKYLRRIELRSEKGQDGRPTTRREHLDLHES